MLLDVPETPMLKSLQVNGRLQFINNGVLDIHLRSKQIFVHTGEFLIGNSTHPFTANAKITLGGKQNETDLFLQGLSTVGNKIFATVSNVEFFGIKRDRMTRLTKTAYIRDTEILVETGLDWQTGDEIYIAPNAMQYDHSEYRTIKSYNAQGGIITLHEPLEFYHWGNYKSTAEDFNGADMRAEIVLLSRNIKIEGEDNDGWGGQILVTDKFETNGRWLKGSLIFDNVQVYNCSQHDTLRAAIRWENGIGGHSRIENSVVHGGKGWLISVQRSNNVVLKDSSFIGGRAIGVHLDYVRNVTMSNTLTADIMPRNYGTKTDEDVADKEACVAICSYFTDGSPCKDLTITNNIAAGCKFAGFIAPGYDCDEESSTKFKDNVSHSNNGVGALIYPDKHQGKQHNKCYELSHFTGYKTTLPCVATHYETEELRAHHLTCIDSEKGISLQTAGESDKAVIKFADSHIYGETEALDCPDPKSCYCNDKMAFMLFGNNIEGQSLHIQKASNRPIYKIESYSAYGSEVQITNVRFKNFNNNGKTKCDKRQTIFARNPYSSDKIPLHKFSNCKFTDVDDNSMAFFSDPNPAWANSADCGEFPCTAPNNILMTFIGTSFNKQTPTEVDRQFQIIPDDPDIGGKVGSVLETCQFKQEWRGYYCRDRALSYLMFESLDDDAMIRNIQPVSLLNEKTGYNNTLNSMMDHVWGGFYTG